MSVRMFGRCLANPVWKSVTPYRKLVRRYESVLPVFENSTKAEDQIEFESLYRNFPNAEGFLDLCRKFNLDERILAKTIEHIPQITTFEPSKISNNIQQFLDLGFESVGIATIIQNYPLILDYEPNQIIETFEAWRSGYLYERFLRKLFIEHSWLLSANNEEVKVRLNRIFYLMHHKINRVTSLLLTSPTIMLGDWKEVEDKFMYCLKEMRYLEKEISRSTALAQSMSRIKLRHIFLERVGIYVRPGIKDMAGMNPHENPPLAEIVDPDDKEFAVNTAKVSFEEYSVFLKLMRYDENDVIRDSDEEKPDNEFDARYH